MKKICSRCGNECETVFIKSGGNYSTAVSVSDCCQSEYKEQEEKTYTIQFTESQIEQAVDHGSRLPDDIYSKFENCFKEISDPQIGDRCAFWDDDSIKEIEYTISELSSIDKCSLSKYRTQQDCGFKNCAKIKKEAEF